MGASPDEVAVHCAPGLADIARWAQLEEAKPATAKPALAVVQTREENIAVLESVAGCLWRADAGRFRRKGVRTVPYNIPSIPFGSMRMPPSVNLQYCKKCDKRRRPSGAGHHCRLPRYRG